MLCLAALIHRRSLADLGSAVHFLRIPEQIKAFPSPSLAAHFPRSPRLSRASPSRGCAPLCFSLPSPLCSMRSSSVASPSKTKRFHCQALRRISVAVPLRAMLLLRDAELGKSFAIRCYAMPSRSIALLRRAVATPARSRRSTRSGPCRCCATARCRGTGRSRAIPARAASPTCS